MKTAGAHYTTSKPPLFDSNKWNLKCLGFMDLKWLKIITNHP